MAAGSNSPSQEVEASETIRWQEGAALSPCVHLQLQPSHQTLPASALRVLLSIDSGAAGLVDSAQWLVRSIMWAQTGHSDWSQREGGQEWKGEQVQ